MKKQPRCECGHAKSKHSDENRVGFSFWNYPAECITHRCSINGCDCEKYDEKKEEDKK